MNRADDKSESQLFDFAVQLQVMVIILLFASLWWFENRLDKIEIKANKAVESSQHVEDIIKPFLEDVKSWQKAKSQLELKNHP